MATAERTSTVSTNFAAHSSTPQQSAIGRMGPWQLVHLLSESELARVYSARPADAPPSQTPRYVVKALRKEWWRDPQTIEMQRRAVFVGQQLSHPHLLPVLSANVQQAPFYYVTPRIPGCTLAQILQQGTRLPVPMSLWIMRQVAEALAVLHESAKMIHSDVKPSNIIVSREGHATLIDLGFAFAANEARHWSARPVTGTLNYIAPEAVTSCLSIDETSDLYSLGVTLYELLAGQVPFCAKSPDELVRMHRESKPTCIRERLPSLPKPVASLVHRLLSKDPLRRPASATTVAEELLRLEIECFSVD
ncbi:serine/threonine-protein kinase [Bythopirellula goksoeyrii]|uniref:Serine/threonine-protein kinase PrkC n=1 Tax=Bythopirellula goksoeyrii TaxID=1400387 RepID=A0A5B9Q778_9BACT|nr:serine/threonine-protein kinase [Bythopirellula goksoeyrii]QEG34837.1 Serine/threonine-protein kinase PrkC [Bythopirellula goksoeyrii]